MTNRQISVLSALFSLIVVPGAMAQSISGVNGTVAHGSNLTIQGSQFGTRQPDPESFFEQWDWGVAESRVDTSGSPWHTYDEDRDPARFSDDITRGPNSGLHLRSIVPDRKTGSQINDIVERNGLNVDPGERVYISNFIWSTFNGATEFGDACPQQWKIMNWLAHGRLSTPCSNPTTGLTWNAEGVDGPPNGDPYGWIHQSTAGSIGDQYTKAHWGQQPPMRNWWQFEVEYQVASGNGVQDGYLRVWFDGALKYDGPTGSWEDAEQNACVVNDGYVYDYAILRNYIQWSQCEARPDTIRHDDTCYQLGTWARVTLGNAPTWAACTKREYQPVTNWGTGAVSVTVNQGGFDVGDDAWVYIVTSTGARSSGHHVVIAGEGQDLGPPGMPEGVVFDTD